FRSERAPWRARPAALAAARAAQAALPAGTLPLERLQVIVPAMAATDPLRLQLDRPAVIAAGRNIIAGMVDCLGSSPGWNDPPQTPPAHGGAARPPLPPWAPPPPGRGPAAPGAALARRPWPALRGRPPAARPL